MAQIKRFTFTNPASAVAKNLDVGFTVSQILSIDTTAVTGGTFEWVLGMANDSYIDGATDLVVLTNGFTPLSQVSTYGADISGFTNAANGVITVNDTVTFGFAVGDSIKVAELADDLTGTNSLNNTFTILSLTDTTITVEEDTSVTGFSVYVSGGVVTRISDVDGFPIPTENFAIQGITLEVDVVGGNDAEMVVIVKGENPVV